MTTDVLSGGKHNLIVFASKHLPSGGVCRVPFEKIAHRIYGPAIKLVVGYMRETGLCWLYDSDKDVPSHVRQIHYNDVQS